MATTFVVSEKRVRDDGSITLFLREKETKPEPEVEETADGMKWGTFKLMSRDEASRITFRDPPAWVWDIEVGEFFELLHAVVTGIKKEA